MPTKRYNVPGFQMIISQTQTQHDKDVCFRYFLHVIFAATAHSRTVWNVMDPESRSRKDLVWDGM